MKTRDRSARNGFTLIELAIVMLIIGLIVAFIASVSFAGIEQARIRATQSLITKLEMGLNERLDALLQRQVIPNGAHQYMASIAMPNPEMPWGLPSNQRAQVIARIDYLRRELPDVFFIQDDANYPINFAARPYLNGPNGTGSVVYPNSYILPIGHAILPGYFPPDPPTSPPNQPVNTGPGAANDVYGEGIFGASYTVRAAISKLIGLRPEGWNYADDNDNDLIDDIAEGTNNGNDAEAVSNLNRFLTNHRHVTARSETLYAILVEGQGPLGSVFSPEEFTSQEVRDTDGDGLPEFVDAWGRPLQFYRWPIFHRTPELQRGSDPYPNTLDPNQRSSFDTPREHFPLDPNDLLVAPAWWGGNVGTLPVSSPKANLFQTHFTCLTDPNWVSGPIPQPTAWDRSGAYARRSFGCKFLIVSAGRDQEYGLVMLDEGFVAGNRSSPDTIAAAIVAGGYTGNLPTIPAENWAAWTTWAPTPPNSIAPLPPEAAEDNIDNQQLQSQSGGIR